MRCFVAVTAAMTGKHVNNTWSVTRQPPIATEKLFEVVSSAGSVPRLYQENRNRPEEPRYFHGRQVH
jgi:hypothetical protein